MSRAIELINHLAMQETAIAELYAAFRDALPAMSECWNDLVTQEKAHADVVWKLAELAKTPGVRLNLQKFNIDAIDTSIAYLEKTAAEVKTNGVTSMRALSLAADVEHSLIDKEYFRIIESSVPQIETELNALEEHTRMHVQLIEKRLREERAQKARSGVVQSQLEMMDKLVRCETGLADLYSTYSRLFPGMSKFWTAIANSEKRHSELAKKLYKGLQSGVLSIRLEGCNAKSIDLFLRLLDDALIQAHADSFSSRSGIVTALSLESSLVETELYKAVQSDSSGMLDIAQILISDTRKHEEVLQNKLHETGQV